MFSQQTLNIVGQEMVNVIQEQIGLNALYQPQGYYGQQKFGGPQDKVASGELYRSVSYRIITRGNPDAPEYALEVYFEGARNEKAAYYVDKGSRSPFRTKPPYSAIFHWIDEKHIIAPGIPREKLTYMIQNSIKKKGIKGIGFIKAATKIMIQRLRPVLEQEAEDDVREILEQMVFRLKER